MQSYVNATFQSLDCAGGVCVVDGYGVQVRVRNRALVVSDGIGRFRRERSFAKALVGIKRLVVISHEGAITLEGLRWLNDAGIAFLQIDRDGEVIAASANYGLNDPRLRRALALAPTNTTGLEIARCVLCAKLAGQEMNLARLTFPENAHAELTISREIAESTRSIPEILMAEAKGALAYWGAWKNVSLRFARKDEKSIPEHWRFFGQRRSPITDSPRLAANPANAMLNYLYALLEAETRFACLACGLDPGLGVFHADQNGRDSLALDLMEAVRPQVDAYLLNLLAVRTFSSKDLVETRRGVCRVLAPLTHTLAETTTTWAQAIAPVVENVAAMLAKDTRSRSERLPTPLTQANRSAGRDGLRRKPKRTAPAPRVRAGSCARCGVPLSATGRLYCDDCLPEEQQETLTLFEEAGPAALAKLRAEGRDPTKTTAAKKKVGLANSRRQVDALRWNAENGRPDEAEFTRAILPGLQGLPLSRMVEATGLSLRYCSQIRRGRVPHPVHWQNLRRLRVDN
jgi:CRISPR-associated endonuclease Cas1